MKEKTNAGKHSLSPKQQDRGKRKRSGLKLTSLQIGLVVFLLIVAILIVVRMGSGAQQVAADSTPASSGTSTVTDSENVLTSDAVLARLNVVEDTANRNAGKLAELEDKLGQLQAEAAKATLIAEVSVLFGLLGLGVGVWSIWRMFCSEKKQKASQETISKPAEKVKQRSRKTESAMVQEPEKKWSEVYTDPPIFQDYPEQGKMTPPSVERPVRRKMQPSPAKRAETPMRRVGYLDLEDFRWDFREQESNGRFVLEKDTEMPYELFENGLVGWSDGCIVSLQNMARIYNITAVFNVVVDGEPFDQQACAECRKHIRSIQQDAYAHVMLLDGEYKVTQKGRLLIETES